MKNLINAGKVLALGSAALAALVPVYLHFAARGPRSPDPYDNLGRIGVGANAAVILLIAVLAGLAALPMFAVAAARDPSLRTRTTAGWSLITLAAPVTLLALIVLR